MNRRPPNVLQIIRAKTRTTAARGIVVPATRDDLTGKGRGVISVARRDPGNRQIVHAAPIAGRSAPGPRKTSAERSTEKVGST